MDIPQVLASLRPNQDWGPCAQSDSTYAALAAKWRGAQPVPTLAEMEAEWAAIEAARPAAEATKRRNQASAVVVDNSASGTLERAVAGVLVDEINALRQWITSFKAAMAAATNFSDLKIRVAALANTPDRTLTQAKSAIQAKATSGAAD